MNSNKDTGKSPPTFHSPRCLIEFKFKFVVIFKDTPQGVDRAGSLPALSSPRGGPLPLAPPSASAVCAPGAPLARRRLRGAGPPHCACSWAHGPGVSRPDAGATQVGSTGEASV